MQGGPGGRVADDEVLEEVTVIDDLGNDHARHPVCAKELGAVFPDGVVRVLDFARDVKRAVGGRCGIQLHEGVKVARYGLRQVEVFRMVYGEADNSGL